MLQIEQQLRDLALFNLAIDSKLRGCDVVAIRVDDVAPNGHAIARATVRQRKTGRPVRFELTEQTRQAINEYLVVSGRQASDYLFGGRRSGQSMTTRQYARLLSEWLSAIGLDPRVYGTHSLRRTKATLIYRRTGNLRAVQLLLGHTKIESTVRYLGIDVDDALAISYEPFNFFLDTRRSRARCGIWASTLTMLWPSPSRWKSEHADLRAERRLCPSR
jgi:integrase